jgi:sugar transferase (PEP-CTERM/EpsH1 system associated)
LLNGEPLTFAYYHDQRMARYVENMRNRDLAAELAFSSSMAPYIAAPRGRPRLLDLCDADSEKWRQYAAERRGPMKWIYAREAAKLAAAETAMINWADAAFAVSPSEAALFTARAGVANPVLICGNGVDADYFSPQVTLPRLNEGGDVVFTGAMDYAANIDAVSWFVREVWPEVRAKAPETRLAIVGSNPTSAVKALASLPGVIVTGKVDDVRPFLQHARVAIAPLRIARGVQNKVLEAMAMGKPVVATSAANAGVGARPGAEILIADDADDFAQAVDALLADEMRADAIGGAARARVLADFRWPARLQALDAVLDRLGLAD